MLRQASVTDIQRGRITKEDGRIVICMRHYPRFLRRELRDEYLACLAPYDELFRDFRTALGTVAHHDAAFKKSKYTKRFALSERGLAELKRLSELSRKQDVYLVCQCARGEMCHTLLLMRMAKNFFNAKIEHVEKMDLMTV